MKCDRCKQEFDFPNYQSAQSPVINFTGSTSSAYIIPPATQTIIPVCPHCGTALNSPKELHDDEL